MTAATIIDERGGPAAFAAALGIQPVTVRMWKHRNLIPRGSWPEVQQRFPELTTEVLKSTEATA